VTSRSDLAQEPPRTGQDLSAFPAVDGPVARQWRAHSVEYGPWFFGATGAGRFDLPDTGDEGTCYFADDVETAVRERLGPRLSVDQTVTPDLAAAFVVSAIVPPEPRRCAATTEAGANSWALFGPRGPDASLTVVDGEQLTGAEACAAAGITVLAAPPPKRAFRVL